MQAFDIKQCPFDTEIKTRDLEDLRYGKCFVQLGFSSNVQLWVTSGGLYFDSLVARPMSDLYYDSTSKFQQSND